jgi:hypothetical protein
MVNAVGPFAQDGQDEPFGLAVGLRAVGSAGDVADDQPVQPTDETAGTVIGPVVGNHDLGADAVTAEPARGTQQVRGCA